MKSIFGDSCAADGLPDFYLADHQEKHFVDLRRLELLAEQAIVRVMANPGPARGRIDGMEEIEVSFVTDQTIAKVHGDFLNDPTPTDVITFHHGEVVISVDTAVRVAAEMGHELQKELALYLIHGLLHLHGHEDGTESGAERMRELQENILAATWDGSAGDIPLK